MVLYYCLTWYLNFLVQKKLLRMTECYFRNDLIKIEQFSTIINLFRPFVLMAVTFCFQFLKGKGL